MRTRQIKNTTRKTVAGLMAVWLSGVMFLFCCHTSQAAAAVASCPMRLAHHCDHEPANDAPSVDAITSCSCVECGYLPVVFDKARKIEPAQKQVVPPAQGPIVTIAWVPRVTVPAPEHTYRARLPDKSRTFISNQVFRI